MLLLVMKVDIGGANVTFGYVKYLSIECTDLLA
jgi:hypothetical protein